LEVLTAFMLSILKRLELILIDRVYSRIALTLGSEIGRAMMRTFIARAVAALGAVSLVLVVGRLYGPEGVGTFALAQSLLLGAGILSRTGMDLALMRFVGQQHNSENVLLYLRWAASRSLLISSLMLVILWCGRYWLGVF